MATQDEVTDLTVTSSPTTSLNNVGRASRKSRFSFTTALDLVLCKAVAEKNAHDPPPNQKMKKMSEACNPFLSLIPTHIRNLHIDPKGKTVSDRFELLVRQRRNNKANNLSLI